MVDGHSNPKNVLPYKSLSDVSDTYLDLSSDILVMTG